MYVSWTIFYQVVCFFKESVRMAKGNEQLSLHVSRHKNYVENLEVLHLTSYLIYIIFHLTVVCSVTFKIIKKEFAQMKVFFMFFLTMHFYSVLGFPFPVASEFGQGKWISKP
jgi:hypothetical protein